MFKGEPPTQALNDSENNMKIKYLLIVIAFVFGSFSANAVKIPGFLPKNLQKTQNFLNDINLNVVGGFIFDHLHQSNKHSIIKSKIISTCSFLKKLNGKVFVIIDHISKERMKTSGKREVKSEFILEPNGIFIGATAMLSLAFNLIILNIVIIIKLNNN